VELVPWRYDLVMALQKGHQIDELLNRHDVIVNGHSGTAIQCDFLFGIVARQEAESRFRIEVPERNPQLQTSGGAASTP